jgi:peptide/nickel transport system substrate-binding protein
VHEGNGLMTFHDPRTQEMLIPLRQNLLTRRQLLKRGVALGLAVPAISTLLAACETDDDVVDDDVDEPAAEPVDDDEEEEPGAEPEPEDDDDEEPEIGPDDDDEEELDPEPDDDEAPEVDPGDGLYGGTLEVALVGEPPSLDIMTGTQAIMRFTMPHAVEFLFTWDEEFAIIPELADTHEVSDDGSLNTVHLRDGVLFHNDDELVAEDVVASIEQWTEISGLGETWMNSVDEIEIVDDLTIEFQMSNPLGTFAPMLARLGQGCAIYPAEEAEAADATGVSEVIGTGPYRVVEHVPDQYILFERFEDYAYRDEEPNGYGGRKYAYLDEIRFIPVPDEAARIAGIQAGDYHFIEEVSPDHHGTLADDPNVVAEPEPYNWATFVFNTREGIMTNQTIRQAAQAALNHEEILQAGYGEGFYRLDPSLMFQETAWHSTAGEELYNRNDPDRARELLEEAGYDGEPIRFLTTQEYLDHYNNSMVGIQQLQDVGFNVEPDFYDWATVGERRADPELWDIFTTGISGVDPALLAPIATGNWPGWWSTDRKTELVQQLQQESEFEARFEIFEELQELFYEEAALIKLGDAMRISARSANLRNFVPIIQLSAFLWNVWLEQ